MSGAEDGLVTRATAAPGIYHPAVTEASPAVLPVSQGGRDPREGVPGGAVTRGKGCQEGP